RASSRCLYPAHLTATHSDRRTGPQMTLSRQSSPTLDANNSILATGTAASEGPTLRDPGSQAEDGPASRMAWTMSSSSRMRQPQVARSITTRWSRVPRLTFSGRSGTFSPGAANCRHQEWWRVTAFGGSECVHVLPRWSWRIKGVILHEMQP